MESEKQDVQPIPLPSSLGSPLAITTALTALFLLMCQIDGRQLGDGYLSDSLLLPAAALFSACMGRVSKFVIPLESSGLRVAVLSAILLLVSLAVNTLAPSSYDGMLVSTLLLVGIVVAILIESNRNEESNLFFSLIVGLHLSASYAAGLEMIDGAVTPQMIDVERLAIGTSFFSFWLASISLGALVTISIRGALDDLGSGKSMSAVPTVSKNHEVMIYSSLIFGVFLIPLVWIGQMADIEQFSEGSHLGVVWAIFTAAAILIHAFFRAEGWHVLGALLAVNWILFSIGRLHEIGNEFPGILGEATFIGSVSWFFIWFWLNFFAVMAASRGIFGDVAPKRETSQLRVWWGDNSYPLLVGLAFVTALVVRTAWNVIPAMNASGTGLWDMTGGSDPWYMKRVVDYVLAERSHLIFDHDRAYPIGGVNPRPPLFSWSLALGGLVLSWLLEVAPEEAVWWSMAGLPAIYGALIVLPIAGIATRIHSKNAGIISAWLIALMPGHISRSTFAMSDHDSFAMLFLGISFYYWIRALEGLENKKMFESTSSNPLYLIAGIRETWRRNPTAMANATMSGIAFTIMALGWKGFVYGPGILFLAYSVQVAINIFRGRDSMEFTSAALQMMLTCILLPAPFYAWPGLNLLFAPSGMQPMFYIIGFTFAVGWVASSFRDKPWLLVIISGSALFGSILAILYILQAAEIYNGWDILFTGGFYFSKNKIFGTIGEAQAPSRGVLFASYGPVVTLIAIGCGFVLLWRGSRRNRSGLTLLGLWAIIATYMAWTAGRFIINATPAMAVVGGIGISMLWSNANFPGFLKVWRNSGIGTPRTRLRSVWPASKSRPGIPALLLVLLLVTSQHATYGIDSGIPRGEESSYDVDLEIYNIAPDILRERYLPIFNTKSYNPDSSGLWYMGTFGPSFNGQGWNDAYDWLSNQDSDLPFSQRPAFVSWWDYGFQALASGQHPTVADNFQSGIPNSGGMLVSAGQEDTLSMFIATLAQGDRSLNNLELSEEFRSVLSAHMSTEQVAEFENIIKNNDRDFVLNRSMAVVAVYNEVELLHGEVLDDDGIPVVGKVWMVLDDGGQVGESTQNQSEAMALFNQTRSSTSEFEINSPAHYDLGGYRYTNDLIDDYYDISTALHRSNARFGLMRAFLNTAFDMETLVNIYDGITSIEYEGISDYESPSGGTTTRNHEIRYFAVDNRLFPLGGSYYDDYSYHRGQTTGIFHAPTHLSGLDIDTYISTMYQTQRGDGPIIPRTQEQYEQEYLNDVVRQQSGASDASEVIRMIDIDYQHEPEFFETMVARIYVGYGSSTLGLPGEAETPSVWFLPQQTKLTGAPGSYLENAFALPGAMMNHFVISNWYDGSECEFIEMEGTGTGTSSNSTLSNVTLSSWDGVAIGQMITGSDGIIHSDAIISAFNESAQTINMSENSLSSGIVSNLTVIGEKINSLCGSLYDSNRVVKVLKYYSGATIEGTVSLEGVGPVPNARILIERDAFSGDEEPDANGSVVDHDPRTYWIPIGSTQADENGHYSFTVPSGKIRVSAFTGDPDLEAARSSIMSTDVGNSMYELFSEHQEDRVINPITGILGNVYGSTWLSETTVNISAQDGHSNGGVIIEAPIKVQPSSASGIITWSGGLDFNGDPLLDASVILTPVSEDVSIEPYRAETSNGTVSGTGLEFTGIGEVTFTGNGSLLSDGIVTVTDFTGTHTQSISNNHSITGEGQFSGRGILEGSLEELEPAPSCASGEIPEGHEVCVLDGGNFLVDGSVNASGRFTSEGNSVFIRTLSQSTFLGSGIFVTDTSANIATYGTLNGTGAFSGSGIFSGPMVEPGTFHISDALPGKYDISLDFDNGTSIDIETKFYVGLVPSATPIQISVSGGGIKGSISDHSGNPLTSPIHVFPENASYLDAQTECEKTLSSPCFVTPDSDGSFQIGPIVPGTYIAELDADEDGFPEISKTYVFTSEEDIVATFPSEIPQMTDITFTLLDGTSTVPDLEVFFTPENESMAAVRALFDSESGTYRAELSQGVWTLNHTLADDKQLWKRIDVGTEDITDSFEFQVSQIVNGTLYYSLDSKELAPMPQQAVSNHHVVFQWQGFKLSTPTDSHGNFSVVLPVDSIIHATAVVLSGVDGFYSNGTSFQVSPGMDDVSIFLVESARVNGVVSLIREGNTYSDAFSGWEPVFVSALNTDGTTDASWRQGANSEGLFEMVLPPGNWTFTLDAGDLSSNSVSREINISGGFELVELLLYPQDNSTVLIDFFIDHEGDNNVSNGTLVTRQFEIKPVFSNGAGITVAADGPEWNSTGRAEISLEPGIYRIVVERANASANDPFDTLYDVNELFHVGMDPTTVERSLGFEPEWLLNLTFRNESGSLLTDHEIVLKNSDNGWIRTLFTDENGRIVEYLGESDWLVIVDEFETSSGVYEGLRRLITVSQETANLRMNLQTSELAEVSVFLTEAVPSENVELMMLRFTSQEGLGTITAQASGFQEPVEVRLSPGNWNLELNQTDEKGVRLLIENTSLIETGVTVGVEHSVYFAVQRLIDLRGTVFWDLNGDGDPGFSEGLANATVSLSSKNPDTPPSEAHYNLTTDSSGEWSIFLPALSTWNVSVQRDGFGTVNSSISLGLSAQAENTEITAGVVEVSGTVSYISEEWIFDDDWSIVLIPSHGIARDRVIPEIVGNESSGWTGEWTASVEPGQWIVYVTVYAPNEGYYLVAVDILDADVEGGFVESVLSTGGVLSLDTEWLDYEGGKHSLSEIDDYDLKISIEGGTSWSEELDSGGELQLLLPAGRVDASSEFLVEQRGRNMSYNGGQGVNIKTGQDSPLSTLSLVRVSNQDLVIESIGGSSVEVEIEQGCSGNDCNYTAVEFSLRVEYNGHNPFDSYVATGTVPGMDGHLWTVEFENENGSWDGTLETSFEMGLDNNLSIEEFRVRVTPANRSQAHHFGLGHMILLKFATAEGYSLQHEMTVIIPKFSGFEISDEFQDPQYFTPEQRTVEIGIPYSNLGNGDEILTFSFQAPEGWELNGPEMQPVSPFSTGMTTIVLYYGGDQSLQLSNYTVFMTVSDSENNSYPYEFSLLRDSPDLTIVGDTIQLQGGGNPVVSQKSTYVVEVENLAHVDAKGVTLVATLCSDIQCENPTGVTSSVVSDVPAQGSSQYYVLMDFSNFSTPDKYFILFEIQLPEPSEEELEACGTEQARGSSFCVMEAQLWSEAQEEVIGWMNYLFILMLGIAIYFLTSRRTGRKPAPF